MRSTDVASRALLAEAVLDNLKEVVFQTDASGHWTFLNPAWEELTGCAVPAALGQPVLDYVWAGDRAMTGRLLAPLIRGEREDCRQEIRYLHVDGTCRWAEVFARLWRDAQGQVLGTCGTLSDITERKKSEEKLRFAASVFQHAGEGIMITRADGTILDVNAAFTSITGYTAEEARGGNPRMLSSGRQDAAFYAAMWEHLRAHDFWQGEVWNRHKSGALYVERLTITTIRDADGAPQHHVGIFSDITKQTQQARHLEHIAHYDPLTGLPNRRLLGDRLERSLAQARRSGRKVVVAYLDLDGFKAVNDGFGHEAGDELLIAVGNRMRQVLREADTLCRLGGDEFVVVLDGVGDLPECMPTIARLLEAVAQPVVVDANVLRVTGSAGITWYPQRDDIDADQLIRQADQAMYTAKSLGKNRYAIFDQQVRPRGAQAARVIEAVAGALARGEFELHYQPIVHLRTGELNAVEALIRWRHPERGLVPPGEFLPLIEGHPIAEPLEDWVLDEAIRQHQRWLAQGLDVAICVNMSSTQLHQRDFASRIAARLAANPAVRPGRIKLEVLETSALDDMGHVSRVIADCAALGVPFALDDFGTGYSSLLYLKQLPASRVKIDQSFVRDMLSDSDDLAILEGILGMAAAFKREVVAEGVESIAHARMLLQMGCPMGQGYGIARPMPAGRVVEWAAHWRLPPALAATQVLDRDSVALLVSGVEHRAWIDQLLEHVADRTLPLPTLTRENCRLGGWLRDPSHRQRWDGALLDATNVLHEDIHALAEAVLDGIEGGEAATARLRAMAHELMASLDRLVDGVAQN